VQQRVSLDSLDPHGLPVASLLAGAAAADATRRLLAGQLAHMHCPGLQQHCSTDSEEYPILNLASSKSLPVAPHWHAVGQVHLPLPDMFKLTQE